MTIKNRERSKKTEGRSGPKNKGGSLAVVPTFKEAVPPPTHLLPIPLSTDRREQLLPPVWPPVSPPLSCLL